MVKPKSSKAHSKHVKRDYHEDEGDMVYAYNNAYCEFRKRVHSKNKDKVKAKPVHVFVDDQDGVQTHAKGRNKTKTRLFRAFKTHVTCHYEDKEDDISRVESFSEIEDHVRNYHAAWYRIQEAEQEVMMYDEHIKRVQHQYKLTNERMNAIVMMLRSHPAQC